MKTLSEGHARFVTGLWRFVTELWRPRFAHGLTIIMAPLLLAGCTASQPVAYQQPMPRYYQYSVQPQAGGYYVHSPYGYDRYVAPSPYAQPVTPPPTYIPNVIPRAEAAEPYTPPSVAQPYTPAAAVQPDPPPTPLRAVDAPGERPVDSSCGWWRLCNFWGSGS
jgi:hypothetical protein